MSDPLQPASGDESSSALFQHLVISHTQMALLTLGAAPHPQTGERERDLDSAKLFIDQLEMLAVKTRGNLTKSENQLLQKSLTDLRMMFVEAVQSPAKPPTPEPAKPAAAAPETPPAEPSPAPAPTEPAPPAGESAKRFSKKY